MSTVRLMLATLLVAACAGGDAGKPADSSRTSSAATAATAATAAPAPAPAAVPGPAPTPDTMTTATTAPAATSASGVPSTMVPHNHGPAPKRAANALSEDDVQDVIDVINGADAQLSGIAAQKASSPEVKRFASRIASSHSQKVTDRPVPLDNMRAGALVSPIVAYQTEAGTRLAGMSSGPAYDKAYMDALITIHERSLSVLDSVSSRASDGDLPALVNQQRTQVKRHLDEARALQRRLP